MKTKLKMTKKIIQIESKKKNILQIQARQVDFKKN